MSKPLVSILIDTYNHEGFIEQAITSVVGQNFPSSDLEIVVVDDGSTDRTTDIVRRFCPRVRLLRKTNGGQGSAFNAAFPELRGQYIALLDGDDWYAPGKLTKTMEALHRHPEVAGVGHGYFEAYDETGEMRLRVPERDDSFDLHDLAAARKARHGWPFLIVGALTIKRETMQRALPISNALTFNADAPIAMSALAGGVHILTEPLCYYRHHATNLHAVNESKKTGERERRRLEMCELMHAEVEILLRRLRVEPECIAAALYPSWVVTSRMKLGMFGGSRLQAFRTELRHFQYEAHDATIRYQLFKALVLGASLIFSQRIFYRGRDWYAQKNLGQLREQFAKSR